MDKYKGYPPACVIAFVCLNFLIKEGLWSVTRYKRPITRLFYMLCGNYVSGWVSNEALELSAKKRCHDHWCSPQTMCYFICDMWHLFKTIDKFHYIWKMCSTTIAVTKEQNDALSGFSYNNNSTGNVLKVSEPITKRYEKLGITLWHKKNGVVNCSEEDFPMQLGDEFDKYEKENLIL